MNVLDLLRSKGIEPKLAQRSGKRGPEYWSSCPGCGGDIGSDGLPSNRFHVWPEQNNGTGSFWCRGCRRAGDRITFLMEFDGKTYPEACRALDIKLEDKKYRTPRAPMVEKTKKKREKRSGIGSQKSGLPPEAWLERAEHLVAWAHKKLLENDEQLTWLNKRGIDRQSVEKFRLGWNPGRDGRDLWRPRESWGLATEMKKNKNDKLVKKRLWIPRGLIIPWQSHPVHRIRIRRLEGEPRYYVLPGSAMDMMVLGDDDRAFIALESELDAIMCLDQAGDLCSIAALGSSSAKPDEKLTEKLRKSALILLGLDYDDAGKKAVRWWKEEFDQVKIWPVPDGGDPGDAYQLGFDIRNWIRCGLPAAWRIRGPTKQPVGLSVLDNKKKRNNQKITDRKVGRPAGQPVKELVAELARLLRAHPVTIHNTSKRTYIASSLRWQQKNWGVYQQISRLVFQNSEIFRFISAHPASKINGKNIL